MKTIAFAALLVMAPIIAFADDAKPLRHLEYSVKTHYTSTETSASYDGTSSSMATSGANETLDVDVVAAANDGGLVVNASVYDRDQHRQHAKHTCAIYPNSTVICPPNDELESEVAVLLAFLGRGFYDPSTVSNGTWKTVVKLRDGVLVNTFRVTGSADTNPLQIKAHQSIENDRTIYMGWISDDDLTYDAKLQVPLAIHDEGHMNARGGATAYSQADFKLVADSFAQPK